MKYFKEIYLSAECNVKKGKILRNILYEINGFCH